MTWTRWTTLFLVCLVALLWIACKGETTEVLYEPHKRDPVPAPMVVANPAEPIPDPPDKIHLIGRPMLCGNAPPPPIQRTLGSPEADRVASGCLGWVGGVNGSAHGLRLRHTALQRRHGWDYWVNFPPVGHLHCVPAFGQMYRAHPEVGDSTNKWEGGLTLFKDRLQFTEPVDPLSPHGLAIPYKHEYGGGLTLAPPGAVDYFHISVLDVTPAGVATVSAQFGHDETTQETKAISKGRVLALRDTGFRILGATSQPNVGEAYRYPTGWLELDPQPLTGAQLDGKDIVKFELRSKRSNASRQVEGHSIQVIQVMFFTAVGSLGGWLAYLWIRRRRSGHLQWPSPTPGQHPA